MITRVQGNKLRISVPLELVTLTSGGRVVTDYEPSEGDVVAVWLRGSKSYRYTPAIEGNVLRWEDNGELWCGCYDLEVRITQADGTKLRAYHTSVLSIVNETSVVTDDDTSDFLAEGAEFDAAIFEIAKGDKGDPGTTDYNELENKPDLSGIERNASNILALAARVAIAEGQIARKQDTLASGENIKTVNGQSLLGSGNIALRSYIDNSGAASVELSVNQYHDLGTLTTWPTLTLPASYDRGDEFVFRFVCGTASLSPVFPADVVLADGFDFSEIALGVVFQVSIMDDVAAYLCVTPNS